MKMNKALIFSCQKNINYPVVYGSIVASRRSFSQEIREIKRPEIAALKRGTGGRSSFSGNVVTVFGATGFLGRYVCNQLGKRGCQLIIPHRSDPDYEHVKGLKLCGDLGQVIFFPFSLKEPASIRKVVKYSNIVINLIGKEFETSNFKFKDVHVDGAREIAAACREYNVERLIHFSSLNVTEKPIKYYLKKLDFLPSKLKGEEAVLEEFPTATIFRPSNIYGDFDKFLWPLCQPKRAFKNSVPLYEKGKKTIKMPVYAKDVALGVCNAINDYDTRGKIYQAVGPQKFTLHDLALFCFQTLQRHEFTKNPLIHDLKFDPIFLARIIFYRYLLGVFFYNPPNSLSLEQIEMESVTDVLDRNLPTLEDLGVVMSKFEQIVPNIILKTMLAKNSLDRVADDFAPAESLDPKAIR